MEKIRSFIRNLPPTSVILTALFRGKYKKKFIPIFAACCVLILAVVIMMYMNLISPSVKYNHAKDLLSQGKYENAINEFMELEDYKDSEKMIDESNYQRALEEKTAGQLELARQHFQELKGYSDSKTQATDCTYLLAYEYYQSKKYTSALNEYNSIIDYKDSKDKISSIKNTVYKNGTSNFKRGRYKTSLTYFNQIKEYKDSKDYINNANYEIGKKYFDTYYYEKAIDSLSHVKSNYKKTNSMLRDSKYYYSSSHYSVLDEKTVSYLKELSNKKYKDTVKLYKNLYVWGVDITVNTDEYDLTTNKTKLKNNGAVAFHVNLVRGEANNTTHLSFRITSPDKSKSTDKWDDEWSLGVNACCGWYDKSVYKGKAGKMTIEVFATDEKGKKSLAGSKTVNIIK